MKKTSRIDDMSPLSQPFLEKALGENLEEQLKWTLYGSVFSLLRTPLYNLLLQRQEMIREVLYAELRDEKNLHSL